MSTKLYVGNLSYTTTADALQAAFAAFGTVVSVNLITDKFTGKSKGFAFVEFDSEESANKAIEAMNQKEFESRTIVVNVAKPREERPRRDFKPRGDRPSYGGGARY